MKRPQIMIVDDEPSMRLCLEAMLMNDSQDLLLMENAMQALEHLQTEKPDVIITDLMMPQVDGIEFCRRLRRMEGTETIQVLMLTAYPDRKNLLVALQAGADEFLGKPVDSQELRTRLNVMLRNKQLHDRQRELMKKHDSLVQMLVHDMRQPLMVLLGNVELLRMEAPDGSPSHEKLNSIERATERLTGFIDDMLLMAKAEEGRLSAEIAPANLSELLRELVETHEVTARQRRLAVDLEIPPTPVIIPADRKLLFRCVENLLSNAMKFSSRDSRIRIEASALDGGSVQIRVRDEGPGVPAEFRGKLFERFGAVGLRQQGVQQNGLGLSLCKMVADLHQGRIEHHPNEPRGSVFTLTLPCS